jgi:hypothetical protein
MEEEIRKRTADGKPLSRTQVYAIGQDLRIGRDKRSSLVNSLLSSGRLVDQATFGQKTRQILHRDNVPDSPSVRPVGEGDGRNLEIREETPTVPPRHILAPRKVDDSDMDELVVLVGDRDRTDRDSGFKRLTHTLTGKYDSSGLFPSGLHVFNLGNEVITDVRLVLDAQPVLGLAKTEVEVGAVLAGRFAAVVLPSVPSWSDRPTPGPDRANWNEAEWIRRYQAWRYVVFGGIREVIDSQFEAWSKVQKFGDVALGFELKFRNGGRPYTLHGKLRCDLLSGAPNVLAYQLSGRPRCAIH